MKQLGIIFLILLFLNSCRVEYELGYLQCNQNSGGFIDQTIVPPFGWTNSSSHSWNKNGNISMGITTPDVSGNLTPDDNPYVDNISFASTSPQGYTWNLVGGYPYEILYGAYFDNALSTGVNFDPSFNSATSTSMSSQRAVSKSVWLVAEPNDLGTYQFQYNDNNNNGVALIGLATPNNNGFEFNFGFAIYKVANNRKVTPFILLNNTLTPLHSSNPPHAVIANDYVDGDDFKIRVTKTGNNTIVDYFQNQFVFASTSFPQLANEYRIMYTPIMPGSTISNNASSFGCNYVDNWDALSREIDGGHYLQNGRRLAIKYINEYTAGTLSYKVKNLDNEVKGSGNLNLSAGYNNSVVLLPAALPSDEHYIFELTDQKGDIKRLRFYFTGSN